MDILLLGKTEKIYNLMKLKEKKNHKNPKKAITNGCNVIGQGGMLLGDGFIRRGRFRS